MKKLGLSVTIGISAYNEEKNIQKLLWSILKQKGKEFHISKIIVISDASTDKTIEKISELKIKNLEFIKNKKRLGQNACYNQILKMSGSDIVVLLEADTIMSDEKYISHFIDAFNENENVGVVFGASLPLQNTNGNITEKTMFFIEVLKEKKLRRLKKQDNLYLSGTGKALSKKIVKTLRFPLDVPEDSFIYFFSKINNIKTIFEAKALLYYRVPTNLHDFLKKSSRYRKGEIQLGKYFSLGLVESNYRLPSLWILSFILEGIFLSPLYMINYLAMNLYARIFVKFSSNYNPLWEISESTKNLDIN